MLILLSLSLAGLFSGLALVVVGNRLQSFMDFLEGAMFGLLPTFVVLRLWPHTMDSLTLAGSIACTIAGVLLARFLKHGDSHDHLTTRIVFPILMIHALTDGTTLAIASHWRGVGWSAGLGIVAHRFPEGLFLAKRFSSRVGLRGASLRLGLLGLVTIIGTFAGDRVVGLVSEPITDALFAIGTGMLVGIVLFDDDHHHGHEHHMPDEHMEHRADCEHQHSHVSTGIGLLLGVLFAALVPNPATLVAIHTPSTHQVLQATLPTAGIAFGVAYVVRRWLAAEVTFALLFSALTLNVPLLLVSIAWITLRRWMEHREGPCPLDLPMHIVGGIALAAVTTWLASTPTFAHAAQFAHVSAPTVLAVVLALISLWLSPGLVRLLPVAVVLPAPAWAIALLLLCSERPRSLREATRFGLVAVAFIPAFALIPHLSISLYFGLPLIVGLIAYALLHPPKQTWSRLLFG